MAIVNHQSQGIGGERGAIVIYAAVMMTALVACSAFVIDYGMQLVSRTQAQTAADAAALAGAGALALGGGCLVADPLTARQTAVNVGLLNDVWGSPPAITLQDVTTPLCPDGRSGCVSVAVYRDAVHGNAIPTLIPQVSGTPSVGVAASATAEWLPAGVTDCLRPFAVPDRWNDTGGAWSNEKTFDKFVTSGGRFGDPLPNPDTYIAPSPAITGTGLTTGAFCNTRVTLKLGDVLKPIRPWNVVPLDLARADAFINPGGDRFYKNVMSCRSINTAVGASVPRVLGDPEDSIRSGIRDLIARDPGAAWDPVQRKVVGGCVAAGTCAQSPRLIAIPLFNPDLYETHRMNGGVSQVTITNFIGFFVSQIGGSDIDGYITLYPGLGTATAQLTNSSAFLRTSVLVQ